MGLVSIIASVLVGLVALIDVYILVLQMFLETRAPDKRG